MNTRRWSSLMELMLILVAIALFAFIAMSGHGAMNGGSTAERDAAIQALDEALARYPR